MVSRRARILREHIRAFWMGSAVTNWSRSVGELMEGLPVIDSLIISRNFSQSRCLCWYLGFSRNLVIGVVISKVIDMWSEGRA